jgi:hypothetical protein
MNNNIYTVKSASELLKSNPQSIRRLINEGKLKAAKKLNKWYILHSDILEYLNSSDND